MVCVGGGCIPDQKPQFVCATEGQQDACKMGSICLHHSCYIGCDMDASMPCKNADQFDMCKSVTTGTGTYAVCGSNANLGNECDLTPRMWFVPDAPPTVEMPLDRIGGNAPITIHVTVVPHS